MTKEPIMQALRQLKAYFGDTVFSEPPKFKAALADVLNGFGDEPVRNLLNIAIGGMNAYERLKNSVSGDIALDVHNMSKEMQKNYFIAPKAALLAMQCFAELLGYSPVSSFPHFSSKPVTPAASSKPAKTSAAATSAVDISKLSGKQKAAILLSTLTPEEAVSIVKHMKKDEIKSLSRELEAMLPISPDLSRAVLEEFYLMENTKKYIKEGKISEAKKILEKDLGETRALEILSKIIFGKKI
ncbi:MAG: hypothetical protein FWD01_02185 [Defluviitaleaceae bacterium]|nr:hypothetical protein [Defluviitaleaceae bacterium]